MMQSRTFVAVLVLACMILVGFSDDGFSQQQSDTIQTSGKQKTTNQMMTWPRKQGGRIQVVADLSVSPLVHTGSCPAVFTFKGRIYANKATAVTYKFIRSDGVHSETKTLVFEKEGRQEVTYTWEMGDLVKLPTFRGGAVMQVIYPINMKIQSNEAIFRGTCLAPGMPEPVNPAGQQKVQQGPPAAQSLFPSPKGQQGQPAMVVPPPTGQQVQPPVPFPLPTGQQGQPPVAFPLPTGQQGQPTMPFPSPPGQQGKSATGDGDCVSFDPSTTKVQQGQGRWVVVDGARLLFSFGLDKIEAENALAVIKHYRMDQSCFVAGPRPLFHYMLAGGSAPIGPFPGEDCRSFNPVMTNVRQTEGGWTVVDSNNDLFQFDADKDGADQALAIIKRYGFTHSCMMARGKVDFLYLRR
jgi:hypothetical protein